MIKKIITHYLNLEWLWCCQMEIIVLLATGLLAITACSPNRVTRSQLKNVGYPIKVIKHSKKSTYPDSIVITGKIVDYTRGNCGIVCSGGVLKIQLNTPIPGYNYNTVFVVRPDCRSPYPLILNVRLKASKLKLKDKECYYIAVNNTFDSKGIPFYKISELESNKVIEDENYLRWFGF